MSKANLLIVEDNVDMCETLADVFRKGGYKVQTAFSAGEAETILSRDLIDLVILDLKLPDESGLRVLQEIQEIDSDILVIMITADTNARPAVEAMRNGAYDYLMKPFELEEVKLVVSKALETHRLRREVSRLRREQKGQFPETEIFGNSKAIQDVKSLIKIVADTPRTSVLIEGESGTGKELVANTIHRWSGRREHPLVKINCAAIPDNLLESELFGHEKGAFTDAKFMKKGMFEMANLGTVFLDEISSMRLSLQPKLLRILEEQTFRRIGGMADIQIDVRLIAASNQNLEELVSAGEFREDLLYRLKVMVIKLPPLRERVEDIIPLAHLFLERNNREFNKNIQEISEGAKDILLRYHWPGNVRELKNVLERASILCNGPQILPEHLPGELRAQDAAKLVNHESVELPVKNGAALSLAEMEKVHIQATLKRCEGNKSRTARELGISRSTLREKMKLYAIDG